MSAPAEPAFIIRGFEFDVRRSAFAPADRSLLQSILPSLSSLLLLPLLLLEILLLLRTILLLSLPLLHRFWLEPCPPPPF